MSRAQHQFAAVLASIALIAATGCGGMLEPEGADLSGQWSGSSQGVTLELTLDEDSDDNLSGSGSLQAEQTISVTVSSGDHSGASFSTTLTSSGFEDVTYSGTVDITEEEEVELDGTLNGSGFNNFSITLTR